MVSTCDVRIEHAATKDIAMNKCPITEDLRRGKKSGAIPSSVEKGYRPAPRKHHHDNFCCHDGCSAAAICITIDLCCRGIWSDPK